MTKKQRMVTVVAAAVLMIAVFGGGYAAGEKSATHPDVLTGAGYVGADEASFQVGDTWFGFRSSVSWTDQAGSWHDYGWPACLPKLQTVSDVRFVGTTVWAGGIGSTQVVWVDCRGQ